MAAREPDAASDATRRITLDVRKRPGAVGVRPTVVVDGRTEPAQWGSGTWLVPADRPFDVTVFLFVRGVRFGRATHTVQPRDERIIYRAPWIPFLRGRFDAVG